MNLTDLDTGKQLGEAALDPMQMRRLDSKINEPEKKMIIHTITAEQFDDIFDKGGEDFLPYLDLAKDLRPGHQAKRINVDIPNWIGSRLA